MLCNCVVLQGRSVTSSKTKSEYQITSSLLALSTSLNSVLEFKHPLKEILSVSQWQQMYMEGWQRTAWKALSFPVLQIIVLSWQLRQFIGLLNPIPLFPSQENFISSSNCFKNLFVYKLPKWKLDSLILGIRETFCRIPCSQNALSVVKEYCSKKTS